MKFPQILAMALGVCVASVPANFAATENSVPAKNVPEKSVPAKSVPASSGVPANSVPAKSVPAKDVPAKDVPANSVPANRVPVEEWLVVENVSADFKSKNSKAGTRIVNKSKPDKDLAEIYEKLKISASEPYYFDVKVARNQRVLVKPPEENRSQERTKSKRANRRQSQKIVPEKVVRKTGIDKKVQDEQEEERTEFLKHLRAFNRLPVDKILAHPAAEFFPGSVPADALRVSMTFTSDNEIRGWQCTGAYAPAGEVVTVHLAKGGVNGGYKIRIGAHSENLEEGVFDNVWSRFPLVSREFSCGNDSLRIANPFGGMIYVFAPKPAAKKKIVTSSQARVPQQVRFRFVGVVDAPIFTPKTKPAQWQQLCNAPAPWAQIEGGLFKATVPAKLLRDIKNPRPIIEFWDKVIVFLDKAIDRKEPVEPVEEIIFDIDSNTHGGHAGTQIVLPLELAENFLNLDEIKKNGSWPLFFYLAKNRVEKSWTLYGNADSAASILAMCCMKEFTGRPMSDFLDIDALRTKVESDLNHAKQPELLALYAVLLDKFGTKSFLNVLAEFRKSSHAKIATETDRAERFIVDWSTITKTNLAPFFEKFGFKTSDFIEARVSKFPKFEPDFIEKKKSREDGWIGAFPPNGIAEFFSDYNPPIDMSGRTKYAAGSPEEIAAKELEREGGNEDFGGNAKSDDDIDNDDDVDDDDDNDDDVDDDDDNDDDVDVDDDVDGDESGEGDDDSENSENSENSEKSDEKSVPEKSAPAGPVKKKKIRV